MPHWPAACVENTALLSNVKLPAQQNWAFVIDSTISLHSSFLIYPHRLQYLRKSCSDMAEVFGVASGALSDAGFAGQLAQSAAFLYGFVGDIRKAPKTVRLAGEELRI